MDICLNEDKTVLWLATVQGLFSYSLKDGKIDSWHFQEDVPEADYFRCLTRIGETLYLGTMSQGVVRFDIKKESFSHTVSLGAMSFPDISSDGKETVYIATDGNGVHFLSHKDQQVTRRFYHDVNDKEGIRSNSIYSLLIDDRGAVWVGHFQAGWIIHSTRTVFSVRMTIHLCLIRQSFHPFFRKQRARESYRFT